ncbi:MAG: hypothetical protein WCQ21_30990, partial [Verrucomicrobiota bacterium]
GVPAYVEGYGPLADAGGVESTGLAYLNQSDMCLIEYKGKVIIQYFTGDQATTPCGYAEAIYDGTEAQFLRGWFPEKPPRSLPSGSRSNL